MNTLTTPEEKARSILRRFQFPIHQCGYRRLCIAVSRFAENPAQSITKELYPYVAKQDRNTTVYDVESSIRRAILYTWEHGDREVWAEYFPHCQKAPTNWVFIATVSEHLK